MNRVIDNLRQGYSIILSSWQKGDGDILLENNFAYVHFVFYSHMSLPVLLKL